MNCNKVKELLISYLDNEVSHQDRDSIETHLAACPGCREEMEALAETQRELRQALESMTAGVSPSPHAWATVKQRIAAEEGYKVGILNQRIAKLKRGIGLLTAPRPVWQTALASAVSVGLIIGLCLAIPSWLEQSSLEEQIAAIAEQDPQVQELLGDESTLNTVVPVKVAEGNIFYYRITYEVKGDPEIGLEQMVVDATVDLEEARVVGVQNSIVHALSEEQKQRAIEIAKNDPKIEETAVVLNVTALPVLYQDYTRSYTESRVALIGGSNTIEYVNVKLEQSGDIFYAIVNLTDESVVNIEEVE